MCIFKIILERFRYFSLKIMIFALSVANTLKLQPIYYIIQMKHGFLVTYFILL
jgi:hypothetical protein